MYKELQHYINKGYFTKWDQVQVKFSQDGVFRKHAKRLVEMHASHYQHLDRSRPAQEIYIPYYQGESSHVWKLANHLENTLSNDLIGAYVQGSLGTYEETAYSDFDAMVIIKNEVFQDPDRLAKVGKLLHEAQSHFYAYDPLQHHGWFVLTENDLLDYPESYFPVAVLQEGKSLLEKQGGILELVPPTTPPDFMAAFEEAAKHFIDRLTTNSHPSNCWQLKGILSLFMLFPSLYVQARDGKGIFKKDSFGAAEPDFNPKDWAIMQEVSVIRRVWPEQLKFPAYNDPSPSKSSRKKAQNQAPSIPRQFKQKLTETFYQRMTHLVNQMQQQLAHAQPKSQKAPSGNLASS